jgi:hypothetical protein
MRPVSTIETFKPKRNGHLALRCAAFHRGFGLAGPLQMTLTRLFLDASPPAVAEKNAREQAMCRNIKPLFNFDPPATNEEIHDAALQFVRKVSGTTKPSKRNEAAFERAVDAIAACARELLDSLETSQPPRDREEAAAKARARAAVRFA